MTTFDGTYNGAHEFLHTRGKPVLRKKIANNTYLERRDEHTIALILHRTDVVTYTPETISLNTGGWLTVTTKDRINGGLPSGWTVRSTRGTWELCEGGWLNPTTVARFTDGITLILQGQAYRVLESTALAIPEREKQDRHNAAMRKRIGAYVKVYAGLAPAACTLCITSNTGQVGERDVLVTYGDRMGDVQHLAEHMLDGTLPDGLVAAAVSAKGYRWDVEHAESTVKRCLRAYLSNRLLIGATASQHGRQPLAVA